MKRLVGKDIGSYAFDASAKTITLSNLPTLVLENIVGIVNVTDQVIIYSPINSAKGGSISSNVLTLEHDTTTMEDTDKLQIWINLPEALTQLNLTSVTRTDGYVTQVVYAVGGMTQTVDITRNVDNAVTDIASSVS